MLAKIERVERPTVQRSSHIAFETGAVITKKALTFRNAAVGYHGKAVISGIDLEVKTGEKIGICGDNAAGKSTILKTVTGQLPLIRGEITFGSGVTATYFKQEHEDLNPENTILEELAAYSGLDNGVIRNVLGSLLFSSDDVYKKIGVLSGGEVSRVAVAKLMLTQSNLLLLDEPTNHLDIASKEVFEEAIREFEGTVLVVSHDRYLLNTLADRMLFVSDGKAYVYNERYERANELFTAQVLKKEEASSQGEEKLKKARPQEVGLSKNKLRQSRERLLEIEGEWEAIEEEKAKIETAMNGEDFYKDPIHSQAETARHQALIDRYAALEDEWLELTELLENND